MTTPSTILAHKCVDFLTECLAHSLTETDIGLLVEETMILLAGHGPDQTQAFVQRIRAQAVIYKLHSTCERLRRGSPTPHTEGEVTTK